jgi:hypothetical protein
MIEIPIVPDNEYFIETSLKAVQQSNYARLLSYSNIEEAAKIAESLLTTVLRKQDRQNIRAWVRPKYPPFSANYRGFPTHTQCFIRRGKTGWFMYDASRSHATRAGSSIVVIDLKSLDPKIDGIINFVTKSLKGDSIVS